MIFIPIMWLALASYFDLKYKRIPNWLTYPAILISILAAMGNISHNKEKFHLLNFLIFLLLLSIFLIFFTKNLIGGGDIKLGIAIAIWSDAHGLPQNWLTFAFLIGGLYALILRSRSIVFAPFMALGFLIANFF